MTGGEVLCTSSTGSSSAAIYMGPRSTSVADISGTAIVTGPCYGISSNGNKTTGNGSVYIHGGTVTATCGTAILNQASGLITISNGIITTNGEAHFSGVCNNSTGTINITGGTIEVKSAKPADYVTRGVMNSASGIVNISGGTITSNSTNKYSYGVCDYSTGHMNISGTASIKSYTGNTIMLARTTLNPMDSNVIDLFGKSIYGHNSADIVVTGVLSGKVYEVNSSNYGSGTLNASGFSGGYTFISWTSDSARANTISTSSSATITALTTASNKVYAYIFHAPTVLPTGITFADTDLSDGEIGGSITWTAANPATDITGYRIYWGSNSVTKLSTNPLVNTVLVASPTWPAIPANTVKPVGANYFLIYSYNDVGDSTSCGSVLITDVKKVVLAAGSLGTAGDASITGLTSGLKYKVTKTDADSKTTTYFVQSGGTLSTIEAQIGNLSGIQIIGLTNAMTYKVEYATPLLASGSLGTAGNGKITVSTGVKYKVTSGTTTYFVKSDGKLTTDETQVGDLTDTEITNLANGSTYKVEAYSTPVLSTGSLGTARDGKIINLIKGIKYKITYDGTTYYVKFDGTFSTLPADIGGLPGTQIADLTNGTTYKVEYATVLVSSGSLGAADDGKITGLDKTKKYKVTTTADSKVYYVNAKGELSDKASDAAAGGNTITGLTNGSTYKVEEYIENSGGSGGYVPSTDTGAKIDVGGNTKSAGKTETSTKDGKTTTTVSLTHDELSKVLEGASTGAKVTIPITTGSSTASGKLDGQAVKDMEKKDATLVIQTGSVSYSLPASDINIDSVSGKLGQNVSLSDIAVNVSISAPSDTTAKVVNDAASSGGFAIQVPAVEFTVNCTYGGKTVEVSSFNSYVERTIAIPEGVDARKITTGIVVEASGVVHHVPTEVIVVNEKYYAKINSLTNSVYTLIYNPIKFNDVERHWAKDAINDMGSRLVVSGVGSNNYDPDRSITRAEMAAIMVRALGLEPSTGTNAFNDVVASAWYCKYVETASTYGIIKGNGDGTFDPNGTITREQAMTMLSRAMKVAGLTVSLTDSDISGLLAGYADSTSLSDYAKEGTMSCIKAGIVSGTSKTTLSPKNCVTRAEVAVMSERLLKKSGLI